MSVSKEYIIRKESTIPLQHETAVVQRVTLLTMLSRPLCLGKSVKNHVYREQNLGCQCLQLSLSWYCSDDYDTRPLIIKQHARKTYGRVEVWRHAFSPFALDGHYYPLDSRVRRSQNQVHILGKKEINLDWGSSVGHPVRSRHYNDQPTNNNTLNLSVQIIPCVQKSNSLCQ